MGPAFEKISSNFSLCNWTKFYAEKNHNFHYEHIISWLDVKRKWKAFEWSRGLSRAHSSQTASSQEPIKLFSKEESGFCLTIMQDWSMQKLFHF